MSHKPRSTQLCSPGLPLSARSANALATMLLAAAFGTYAHAQAGADCVPGGTVQQTNACAIKDFQQADTDHQILYGDVMRALSAMSARSCARSKASGHATATLCASNRRHHLKPRPTGRAAITNA